MKYCWAPFCRWQAGGRSDPAPASNPGTLEMYPFVLLRLLLVEDNHVNQKVTLLLLRKLGCRAGLAANGIECLKAFEARDYDVVLMDMMMPEMDGLDATRAIRRMLPANRQPVVIALTAMPCRKTWRIACGPEWTTTSASHSRSTRSWAC